MGILDDLKMGFGFKEKDRDYYDRTAATVERNSGKSAGDKYKKYVGFSPGGHTGKYADAPNYSSPIGPNVSDFRQGSRPSNAPTPGTFSHSMGKMPGMMGLLARFLNGSGNNLPEQPLMSNAQRQVRPQRRGAPQGAAQYGYTAPAITSSPLTDMSNQMSAGPNMMTDAGPRPNTQFSPYDASGTFMEMSQPDSNMFGVAGGMPAMPATEVDATFAPRMDSMAIDAPATAFPAAGGAVMADSPEADEAAYQQWLSTEGSSKLIQQWDKTNPGFSRRMYDTARRIKAGKF